MKPAQRPFDKPTQHAQAVFVFSLGREHRLNAHPAQEPSQILTVKGLVANKRLRPLLGPSRLASHRGHVHDQREQRSHVVPMGGGQLYDQRHAARVGQQAMFATRAAPIRGIRPGFGPPSGAFTKLQSTSTRDQSSWSAPRSFAKSNSCMRCHNPIAVHWASRRVHVLYETPKASVGKSFQPIPVFKTKRMAVSTRRASLGGRPPSGEGW